MQKRLMAVVVGAGALFVGAGVGAFSAAAGAAPSLAAADQVSALARPQVAADALPSYVDRSQLGVKGLSATSTRLVGQGDGVRHWAAEGPDGQVCLVTVLGSGPLDAVVGSACVTAEEFAAEGLTLQVVNLGRGSEAHLLPDGYAEAAKGRAELTVVGSNLAVSDPRAASDTAIPLAAGKGAARSTGLKLVDLPAPPARVAR